VRIHVQLCGVIRVMDRCTEHLVEEAVRRLSPADRRHLHKAQLLMTAAVAVPDKSSRDQLETLRGFVSSIP